MLRDSALGSLGAAFKSLLSAFSKSNKVCSTPRSEKVDPVRYQVPAFCYVKPTRDHLQKVRFDLPDRSRGVPELPRANLGPKNLKNRIMWIYFLRAGGIWAGASLAQASLAEFHLS